MPSFSINDKINNLSENKNSILLRDIANHRYNKIFKFKPSNFNDELQLDMDYKRSDVAIHFMMHLIFMRQYYSISIKNGDSYGLHRFYKYFLIYFIGFGSGNYAKHTLIHLLI